MPHQSGIKRTCVAVVGLALVGAPLTGAVVAQSERTVSIRTDDGRDHDRGFNPGWLGLLGLLGLAGLMPRKHAARTLTGAGPSPAIR